ncbi:MAG: DUF6515 family protein [Bacteroidota bacterium]
MRASFSKVLSTVLLVFAFAAFVLPTDLQAQNRRRRVVVHKKARVVTTYRGLPRRGATVTVLPRRTVVVRHGRLNYHFAGGVFYKPVGRSFVVVAPPRGIRIRTLPTGYYAFNLARKRYFYHYGTYYTAAPNGGYVVVQAPVGARVNTLPDGYVVVNGRNGAYYKVNDDYYQAITDPDGHDYYEVVDFS